MTPTHELITIGIVLFLIALIPVLKPKDTDDKIEFKKDIWKDKK